ncbi:hypothetical protein LEMLEM_LOCUS23155 [Lemmus lemmus]
MYVTEDVRGLRCLEAGVTVVVSHLTWVLGSKLGSSAKAVCTLNHKAISPAPCCFLFGLMFLIWLGFLFVCLFLFLFFFLFFFFFFFLR